jgi:hypothetical protein
VGCMKQEAGRRSEQRRRWFVPLELPEESTTGRPFSHRWDGPEFRRRLKHQKPLAPQRRLIGFHQSKRSILQRPLKMQS